MSNIQFYHQDVFPIDGVIPPRAPNFWHDEDKVVAFAKLLVEETGQGVEMLNRKNYEHIIQQLRQMFGPGATATLSVETLRRNRAQLLHKLKCIFDLQRDGWLTVHVNDSQKTFAIQHHRSKDHWLDYLNSPAGSTNRSTKVSIRRTRSCNEMYYLRLVFRRFRRSCSLPEESTVVPSPQMSPRSSAHLSTAPKPVFPSPPSSVSHQGAQSSPSLQNLPLNFPQAPTMPLQQVEAPPLPPEPEPEEPEEPEEPAPGRTQLLMRIHTRVAELLEKGQVQEEDYMAFARVSDDTLVSLLGTKVHLPERAFALNVKVLIKSFVEG